MNCIQSCIRVAHVTDIIEQHQNLLHVLSNSLAPSVLWTGDFHISVFPSLLTSSTSFLTVCSVVGTGQLKCRSFHQ